MVVVGFGVGVGVWISISWSVNDMMRTCVHTFTKVFAGVRSMTQSVRQQLGVAAVIAAN